MGGSSSKKLDKDTTHTDPVQTHKCLITGTPNSGKWTFFQNAGYLKEINKQYFPFYLFLTTPSKQTNFLFPKDLLLKLFEKIIFQIKNSNEILSFHTSPFQISKKSKTKMIFDFIRQPTNVPLKTLSKNCDFSYLVFFISAKEFFSHKEKYTQIIKTCMEETQDKKSIYLIAFTNCDHVEMPKFFLVQEEFQKKIQSPSQFNVQFFSIDPRERNNNLLIYFSNFFKALEYSYHDSVVQKIF